MIKLILGALGFLSVFILSSFLGVISFFGAIIAWSAFMLLIGSALLLANGISEIL